MLAVKVAYLSSVQKLLNLGNRHLKAVGCVKGCQRLVARRAELLSSRINICLGNVAVGLGDLLGRGKLFLERCGNLSSPLLLECRDSASASSMPT